MPAESPPTMPSAVPHRPKEDNLTDPAFEILAPRFDAGTGLVELSYRLGEHAFTETLALPAPGGELSPARAAMFAHLLDLTAAVLGVSYYKLRAPLAISAEELALTDADRAFILDVYENGLGEFFARNGLRRFGRMTFESGTRAPAAFENPGAASSAGALVPIGGGKDSLVSLALLEEAGVPITLFAVNPKGPIAASAERAGLPLIGVRRTLDPEMLRLSRMEAYYNGHVPSTAVNSMIASLVAVLGGHDRIVLSNERSASEGNVEFDGRIANHQYSKSLAFERSLAQTLARATGDQLDYFSLLRPFSEARIATLFARSTRFDDVFSSCNRNFTQIPHQGPLWCGICPKCHFVFLIFAPAMPRQRLEAIFGMNVLDTPANLDAFRELTGLSGHKPWECVGEILEAAACLWRIADAPDWRDTVVVKTLAPELEAFYGAARLEAAYREVMEDSADHLVPDAILQSLDSAVRPT